ncbi:MAG: glycosyltransferase family 2 protein [Chloroflexus sp.]|uniref:glycosyltransferase family 2 protein n=1 Tax=unclassified Chloroflexus TaxID=2633855 RepID=UPI0004DF369C|nr:MULTISPECIES: glycosyltransferase family A protein [unclassified Chloroflexus]MBO9312480.1 glycosyltransferase family 2 protein [Chloroflexus sp.]MBO9315354.1 glycosyltransferase family 2 protein [Chloroflexus sp.]MBO9317756.1 glycosyltransferase family 2 protein [Chloroflexus sp.]MBO9337531.1 glycosyltransferase family 2 protein [Chloroflexus sp.]MBO9348378.1 glycosyltransferase family 2 protein [Chloroflexus sp.]
MTASNDSPLLSVTVLNYNYAHFLSHCLDSILQQSFTDFEVILINDRSTDNSLAVIKPYLRDPRIRFVDHAQNQGFVASLIEGMQLSRGKYLSVISADDWVVSPHAFARQIEILERHPQVVMAFSAYGLYADEQTLSFVSRAAPASYVRDGRSVFADFLLKGYPQHSGTMIRKSAYQAIGGYDPKLRWSLDAQMWLGLCHFGDIAYIDEMLYAYRRHPSSMSKDPTALRNAIIELFNIFDWTFGLMPETERRKQQWLYRKARQRALISFAADAVFSGNVRLGWQFYKVGLQVSPWETLFQKGTLAIALRALLGARLYDRLFRRAASTSSGRPVVSA